MCFFFSNFYPPTLDTSELINFTTGLPGSLVVCVWLCVWCFAYQLIISTNWQFRSRSHQQLTHQSRFFASPNREGIFLGTWSRLTYLDISWHIGTHTPWEKLTFTFTGTHLKFNIAPENIPSQKEISLPTILFQGLYVGSREGNNSNLTSPSCISAVLQGQYLKHSHPHLYEPAQCRQVPVFLRPFRQRFGKFAKINITHFHWMIPGLCSVRNNVASWLHLPYPICNLYIKYSLWGDNL